jgi:hypothetical protein
VSANQDNGSSGRLPKGVPFTAVPNSLYAADVAADLTDAEHRAYSALAFFDWRGDGCWPSIATIAEAMGCSEDKAGRALASLRKKGLVEVRRGQRKTNTYQLLIPETADPCSRNRSRPDLDSGDLRVLDSGDLRYEENPLEENEGEADTNPLTTTDAVALTRTSSGDTDEARSEILHRLQERVLPLVEDADEGTERTWARVVRGARYPIDPGLADYLEAKYRGEKGLEPLPVKSARYVTRVLQEQGEGNGQSALADRWCWWEGVPR